jgi:small-conductance mechanosensitive channel
MLDVVKLAPTKPNNPESEICMFKNMHMIKPSFGIRSLSWRRGFMVCLLACLTVLAYPTYAEVPGTLLGPSAANHNVSLATPPPGSSDKQLPATIREKIKVARIRHQEVRTVLAGKNPPSYASIDELSSRQIQLFSTISSLESWLNSLENIQKAKQAERDLESKIQSWSGFGFEEPYPLSLSDQLSSEIRSRYLELQTEQERTTLEEHQIPGHRKALEQTGPKIRKAAEAFEKAQQKDESRLRWLMESAYEEKEVAEARLQATLARIELNKLRVSLLEREIEFLEEKQQQTIGKTEFSRADLDARLGSIAKSRALLQEQLTESERQNNLAQEHVTDARVRLEQELAGEGRDQTHVRQLFELRQVEAETTAQRVETLKLLLAANTLETILWQERFRVYNGLEKKLNLTEVIQNLDKWQERISEFDDYYTSKVLLTRTRIQGQNETLKSWPEQQPGKPTEEAKREAYQERLNDLEQLIASIETINFLTERLKAETFAEMNARSFLERLQIRLTTALRTVSSIWNYEIFSVDDTIIADGKVISGSRPVTLKKVIYGLLLLTVGIWLVGRVSKLLSHIAQRSLKVDRSLILLFEKIGQYLAIFIVIVAALGLVQIPFTAFAFLGGALAIGVGFGGQNLINNFMSSLILLIEKPIKTGDIVEVEGILGRVTAIGGRCSTIRRVDGVDLLVPNSQLLEKTVVNRTLADRLVRYEIKVGVAYGSPTRDVFRILEQVVDEHGLVLKDPKPLVLLEDFAADALLFGIYYWIEVNDRLDSRIIASDLRHRIDRLFRDAVISIAFPQRDVHLDTANPLKIQMVADLAPKNVPTQTESLITAQKDSHDAD